MRICLLTTDNREPYKKYNEPAPSFGTAPAALMQGFERLSGIEIHVVSCIRQPVSAPEKLAPNIFFHSLVVPKTGWIRTLFQGCIRATRKKIREIQPDIVHGQGTENDCCMNAVFSGLPNVLTIHGNMRRIAALNGERPFSYNWTAARLEGFVLPRTNGVVCITEHTRNEVKSLARRTWVLPNAVDTGFFDISAAGPSAPVVGLCVGSICPLKNQNALIRALDPLARSKHFKLVFAGAMDPYDYGREFQQLISERPWCEYIGFINREQLKAQLSTASFLVLPTLEDNCPMVVLEAMAAGVPVVASAVGGVPELIEAGKTGLLGDPRRPESFREGVERLLTDSEWARHLAAAAKEKAMRRFHPEAVAQQHLEIYREVLAKAGR